MSITKKCPNCGRTVPFTSVQAQTGAPCPDCGEFIKSRHVVLTDEDCARLAAAIHEMMRENENKK